MSRSAQRHMTALGAICLSVTLGGCMSQDNNDINTPLPVMSEQKAVEWARGTVSLMARSAEVTLDEKTERPRTRDCLGKNGEEAEDGRFTYTYTVRAPLPVAAHAQAIRKVRDDLKERGYTIDGVQEMKGDDPSVILDASGPGKGLSVAVETVPYDSLLFSATTPCLLPPGKKQQTF